MQIPFIEPRSSRFIYIHPESNVVHLFVPIVEGPEISRDNTCKAQATLQEFFLQKKALIELKAYATAIQFDLTFLNEDDPIFIRKNERLNQIKLYINFIKKISYHQVLNTIDLLLHRKSNLFGIHLRPLLADPISHSANPVFSILRTNDEQGTPHSALFNAMYQIYPQIHIKNSTPILQLKESIFDNLVEEKPPSFEWIQETLSKLTQELFKITVDFYHQGQELITQSHIDNLLDIKPNTPLSYQDCAIYIDALINICAQDLNISLETAPFSSLSDIPSTQVEQLSILTQFFLAHLNIYCAVHDLSSKNFGQVLDESARLSEELALLVQSSLINQTDVEYAMCQWVTHHRHQFGLSKQGARQLSLNLEEIKTKFKRTYQTVTATAENSHMDDFLILEPTKKDIFFQHQSGSICIHFSSLLHPNHSLAPSRTHFFSLFTQRPLIHEHSLWSHIDADYQKLNFLEIPNKNQIETGFLELNWDKLMLNYIDSPIIEKIQSQFSASLEFKQIQFLYHVALGRQSLAHETLRNATEEQRQSLLLCAHRFSDYSERVFHCTAYEYTYWSLDTNMRQMLESWMSKETAKFLLEKIDIIEQQGLSYQQGDKHFSNPHYDISFVFKDLTLEEFKELKNCIPHQMLSIIHEMKEEDFCSIMITASEFIIIQEKLAASKLAHLQKRCHFDFTSLHIALHEFLNIPFQEKSEYFLKKLKTAWLKIGLAQREVPVHIANEYCKQRDAFSSLMQTTAEQIPFTRELTITNHCTHHNTWFPLSPPQTGLGYEYSIIGFYLPEAHNYESICSWLRIRQDFTKFKYLYQKCNEDLMHSLNYLAESSKQNDSTIRSYNIS